MNQPNTIYDVLVMLSDYHQQRAKQYEQLGKASVDPRAGILLEHLVELETHSMQVIQAEMQQLAPEHSTYLISGPKLSVDAMQVPTGTGKRVIVDEQLMALFNLHGVFLRN